MPGYVNGLGDRVATVIRDWNRVGPIFGIEIFVVWPMREDEVVITIVGTYRELGTSFSITAQQEVATFGLRRSDAQNFAIGGRADN